MEKVSLKDKAYNILKSKIINNEFPPNSFLEEKDLCAMLEASRTPVRGAMVRLARENFLELVPQKGARVKEMTLQNLVDIIKVRKAVEPPLVAIACKEGRYSKEYLLDLRERFCKAMETKDWEELQRLDYEFHSYLYSQSQNPHLIAIMGYVSDQVQRVRTMGFNVKERSIDGAPMHITLIDTLLNKELDKVQKLMLQHIKNNEDHYLRGILNISVE